MPELTAARKLAIVGRTIKNIALNRPITVSFEITYNCNAHCEHCDLGDYVKEPRLGPEVFARWLRDLAPVVAQISGGEPMLRKDIVDIIREMRAQDALAVFVLTTNVSLLTEKKYHQLREAGVDKFSFSLDYPDEHHDEFRHLKGNFKHIKELVQQLSVHGNRDIILACVVQSDNFHDLPQIAQLAKDWGVAVNFSTYNSLRTDKTHYLINSERDLEALTDVVDRLVRMRKSGYPILTSAWTMRQMIRFFRENHYANCRAGERFLIVGPWGKLTPCGMFREQYDSRPELLRKFTSHNTCDRCFTAIRANSEKTPYRLFVDALRASR